MNNNLGKIYKNRFSPHLVFRNKMYEVLCEKFFQKYISKEETVLELAAGYCEFINNIDCKNKIAVDLNSDVARFAAKNVKTIICSSTKMDQIASNSIDVVFLSNFFEHLEKQDIIKTIEEIKRILKKSGKLLILQPNIRYCYKDYWMFFDHITPIDHRALVEILEVYDFKIKEVRPKFLPYTINSRFPKSLFLVKIYLKFKILHCLFGKQAFVYCINN